MCFSSSSREHAGAIRFRRIRYRRPCCFIISSFLRLLSIAADNRDYRDAIAVLRPLVLRPRDSRPKAHSSPGRTRTVFFSMSPYLPKTFDRFSFSSSTFREIGAFLLSLANPRASRYRIIFPEEGRLSFSIWTCKFSPDTRGRAASQKGTVLRNRKRE